MAGRSRWTLEISTHAPLAGRDQRIIQYTTHYYNFNPRAPCGARQTQRTTISFAWQFQPTRPLRGATNNAPCITGFGLNFNPRAPCGARRCEGRDVGKDCDFNPRAPCGARLSGGGSGSCNFPFQPTRPLRGATAVSRGYITPKMISTHAPLAGRDSKSVQITMHIFAITDKFQMLLHRMPPVRAFCSFLMQENHADFGCEPPK